MHIQDPKNWRYKNIKYFSWKFHHRFSRKIFSWKVDYSKIFFSQSRIYYWELMQTNQILCTTKKSINAAWSYRSKMSFITYSYWVYIFMNPFSTGTILFWQNFQIKTKKKGFTQNLFFSYFQRRPHWVKHHSFAWDKIIAFLEMCATQKVY